MPLRFVFALLSLTTSALAQPLPFDIQGHRGCRGLMPENSILAFLKALDLGVTTLELDVVISQDRKVVVSHDAYINSSFCLDPSGKPINKKSQEELNLYLMTYDAIKKYDCGSQGNSAFPQQQLLKATKPLLSEVIEAAESYRKQKNLPFFAYSIEIKSTPKEYDVSQPQPAQFSDLVYAIILEQLPPERVILQSFDFNILAYWNEQIRAGRYQKVQLAALISTLKNVNTHLKALGFTPAIYSPYHLLVGKRKILRIHRKGMKVIPWTVNSPKRMKKLKAWGADGLITDYPDRAKAL
ncbi:glycerophosphodiester phosphodiesterase family protein [Tellurirhabdus bombi]|uniref:glycerophosphodiester phosphodiesterase family protein n=1 Tax=Tellurirhabdus bombi TaxID=2907205 RepID=UPI001F1A7FC0|nr:glycerophosphodiester phosphodiesterase family protein [Tellurirhabdus bombi]